MPLGWTPIETESVGKTARILNQDFAALIYYCRSENAEGGVFMKNVDETFRSESGRFDREFGEYLMIRKREGMAPETCTFFEDRTRGKKWARCTLKEKEC
jgi:hypothetical protein